MSAHEWRSGAPDGPIILFDAECVLCSANARFVLKYDKSARFPPAYPTVKDIWMGAGPVPEILHRALNLLAKLLAVVHLPSLEPLSRLFYAVLNRMRFGEHRGGMFVNARGVADGRALERSWHLIAEGDDGLFIPSMASEAVIRGLLVGKRPEAGARSGVGALDLADYDTLFNNRQIDTGFRERVSTAPLYRQILGSSFDTLPPRLQELHDTAATRRWSGFAEVRRGRGFAAELVAAAIGFPKTGVAIPVTVSFTAEGTAERCTRNFDGRRFSSPQSEGIGKDTNLLVERFGIVSIALALVVDGKSALADPAAMVLARHTHATHAAAARP